MAVRTESINLDVLGRLTRLYASGRLAHAYLFTGPKGSGKVNTALALAQAVNCLEPSGFKSGCACSSCHKITTGNHPDIFMIEKPEDKAEILIGQITPRPNESYRPLLPWLSVRALEARVRVVIIKDADFLTENAANAFLKTLEEPRPGMLFLLTSAASDKIIRTISSRCHAVRFCGSANSVLADDAGNEYDVSLFDKGNRASGSDAVNRRLCPLSQEAARQKNAMIDEFILGVSSEVLLKKWSVDKEKARGLLDVVLMFYRDVLCVKNGVEDGRLFNSDRLAEVHGVAGRMTGESVQAVLGQAIRAIEAVSENFNLKVALTLLKEEMR